MPRVSVIIPAHNSSAFLPETLASVHAQTFEDWEIVAVDDGSTDATWTILEGAGARVRALRNEHAHGPAGARNRALKQAGGELVVFLDADDLLLPRYLEHQVACLDAARRSGRKVGVVSCDALLLDGDGYARYTYLDLVHTRRRPVTLDLLLRRNPIFICSLVPSEVGAQVGWFDEELFGTEDYGLWLKILERGYESVLNPQPLAVYRRGAGSVSSNIARQGANNRRTYELALARGALNDRQQRIARRAVRYNRAMELVASLRFDDERRPSSAQLLRAAPLVVWVVLTNPRWWAQWLSILRGGR